MRAIIVVLFTLIAGSASAQLANEEFGPEIICPAVLEANRNGLLKKYEHLPEEERLKAFEKDHVLFGLWQPFIRECIVVDLVPEAKGTMVEKTPREIIEPTLKLMVMTNEISDYKFSDDMTYAILEL